MNGKKIEIVIDPSGEIKIDALNFQGADCTKATKFLEEALGKVSDHRKKPEFIQTATQSRKAVQ